MMGISHRPVEIDLMVRSAQENVDANPGYADLRNQLGLLYTLKKKYQEARAQFQQALMINPFYLEARLNLAFLHIRQKNWEEAEVLLKECIATEPDDSLCNHTLGVVFLMRGNKIRAIGSFERAAELDPFHRLQYEKFGALRGDRIILDGSSERKLKENGENLHRVNLHHFVGQCYAEMGEIAKAVREFRKANRIHSDDYRCPLNIGKLYELQGKYKKAIEEFQKAVATFPECGMAHAHMSYAYAGIGDLDKALVCLKRAVEIHPQYADLRYQLGLLYEDREMYQEAIHELRKALEIHPKYLFARINLGVLYEKSGQIDEALEQYKKVAELVTEDVDFVNRIDQMKKQTGYPPHDHSNRLEQP